MSDQNRTVACKLAAEKPRSRTPAVRVEYSFFMGFNVLVLFVLEVIRLLCFFRRGDGLELSAFRCNP